VRERERECVCLSLSLSRSVSVCVCMSTHTHTYLHMCTYIMPGLLVKVIFESTKTTRLSRIAESK
jgi:hypothetical protein